MSEGRAALFLDLGGTLVRIVDDEIYVDADGAVEILPRVVETLSARDGELLFVVTNQASIGDGGLQIDEVASFVEQINARIGGRIQDYWACPRRSSNFRKPNPGMVLGLADKHFLDLARSTYVGDSDSDQACAREAGVGDFVWAHEFFGWPRPAS